MRGWKLMRSPTCVFIPGTFETFATDGSSCSLINEVSLCSTVKSRNGVSQSGKTRESSEKKWMWKLQELIIAWHTHTLLAKNTTWGAGGGGTRGNWNPRFCLLHFSLFFHKITMLHFSNTHPDDVVDASLLLCEGERQSTNSITAWRLWNETVPDPKLFPL